MLLTGIGYFPFACHLVGLILSSSLLEFVVISIEFLKIMINLEQLLHILSLHRHRQLIRQLKGFTLSWHHLEEHLLLNKSVLDVLLHVNLYTLAHLVHLDSELFPQL